LGIGSENEVRAEKVLPEKGKAPGMAIPVISFKRLLELKSLILH